MIFLYEYYDLYKYHHHNGLLYHKDKGRVLSNDSHLQHNTHQNNDMVFLLDNEEKYNSKLPMDKRKGMNHYSNTFS